MLKPDVRLMLHPLSTDELLCIFGTGDLGRSLGLRLLQSGYRVVYGSRRPHSSGPLPEGAEVMSHESAAKLASVIFVCVHREHYEFLETLTPHLEGKLCVCVRVFFRLVPGAAVVKGLNTLSAWALQNELLAGKQVYLCGDSAEAKQVVSETATQLGLTVLDRGSLSAARELEDFPLQLFPEWRLPLSVAIGLIAFFFFYLVIRDVIYEWIVKKSDISYRIMVSLGNKVFAIVSLIMLSLCYLPGIIAAFLQLYRGTKYRRFPHWLDRWMLCRKQIGLVALGIASLHAVYTFIIPLRYSEKRQLISSVVAELKQVWFESFYALGILGFFLFVLLGLTSLPSVGGTLSWREFSFIQSKMGHLSLLICTAHGYFYGWDKFLRTSTYKWYTPPAYMLCLIVPSVVLVLKALLLLPCVDRTLTRIRQGWERTQPGEKTVIDKATNL
uniref:Uncharacterized protein n=1 Tax=Mola mola TaxID=94237 RepID=A0A3Q3VRD6_MOLML